MPRPPRAPAREGSARDRRAMAAVAVGRVVSVLAVLPARPRPQRADPRAGAVRGSGVISARWAKFKPILWKPYRAVCPDIHRHDGVPASCGGAQRSVGAVTLG